MYHQLAVLYRQMGASKKVTEMELLTNKYRGEVLGAADTALAKVRRVMGTDMISVNVYQWIHSGG